MSVWDGGVGEGTPSPASSKLAALITSSELECWNGTMHHQRGGRGGNQLISPVPPCGAPWAVCGGRGGWGWGGLSLSLSLPLSLSSAQSSTLQDGLLCHAGSCDIRTV